MEIKVKKTEFLEVIGTVSGAVPARATLPVLSNVLLEASVAETAGSDLSDQKEEGRLRISGTDLDIFITTSIPVDTKEPGAITIPARKLHDIVRELPDTDLILKAENERLSLTCGAGIYRLSGISAEEFPRPPEPETDSHLVKFPMDGSILRDMIEKTAFAVSQDERRPALCGVYWHLAHDQTLMVATDGHRLAKVVRALQIPVDESEALPEETHAILSSKTLSHLTKLLSKGEKLQTVVLGESYVTFELENTTLSSRLIEGPYPNFNQVIPTSNEKRLTVSCDSLVPALRRALILSNADTHQVRLSLRASGTLEVSASSPQIGTEAKETIEAEYSDEDFDVGYNASYLLEILGRMTEGNGEAPKVTFELSTPLSAGIIKPFDQKEGIDYLCLVMPLRLND